jgi:aerobic C4-dicarboxylate transport protein
MNMAGKPFWKTLYFQVLVAIALGILTGWLFPDFGRALKPLGDGFIKLVKMIITPVIFLTVVTGIAGMADLKAFGRVGAKAMAYFLTFSTLALIVGLVVGNVVRPGTGSTSIRQRSIRGGLHLCQQGQGAIGHRLRARHHPRHRDQRLHLRPDPAGAVRRDPVRSRARADRGEGRAGLGTLRT